MTHQNYTSTQAAATTTVYPKKAVAATQGQKLNKVSRRFSRILTMNALFVLQWPYVQDSKLFGM